jgi:hypothetical protein
VAGLIPPGQSDDCSKRTSYPPISSDSQSLCLRSRALHPHKTPGNGQHASADCSSAPDLGAAYLIGRAQSGLSTARHSLSPRTCPSDGGIEAQTITRGNLQRPLLSGAGRGRDDDADQLEPRRRGKDVQSYSEFLACRPPLESADTRPGGQMPPPA